MVPSGHSLDLALLSQGVLTGSVGMHHQSTPQKVQNLMSPPTVFERESLPTHSPELATPHLCCSGAFQSYRWQSYSADLHVFDYRRGKTSFYFLLPFPPHSLPLESCVSQLIVFLCGYSSFPGWLSDSLYACTLLTLPSHMTAKKPPH